MIKRDIMNDLYVNSHLSYFFVVKLRNVRHERLISGFCNYFCVTCGFGDVVSVIGNVLSIFLVIVNMKVVL